MDLSQPSAFFFFFLVASSEVKRGERKAWALFHPSESRSTAAGSESLNKTQQMVEILSSEWAEQRLPYEVMTELAGAFSKKRCFALHGTIHQHRWRGQQSARSVRFLAETGAFFPKFMEFLNRIHLQSPRRIPTNVLSFWKQPELALIHPSVTWVPNPNANKTRGTGHSCGNAEHLHCV